VTIAAHKRRDRVDISSRHWSPLIPAEPDEPAVAYDQPDDRGWEAMADSPGKAGANTFARTPGEEPILVGSVRYTLP
jgi:hypothetical protein